MDAQNYKMTARIFELIRSHRSILNSDLCLKYESIGALKNCWRWSKSRRTTCIGNLPSFIQTLVLSAVLPFLNTWLDHGLCVYPLRLQDEIMALRLRCFAQNLWPRAKNKQPCNSCSPSLSIHPLGSHLTESESDRDQQREKKALGSESRPYWVQLNICV